MNTENPFASGESRLIQPPSTALVIFGATGDLTRRKLIPALLNLLADGYLPPGFVVIGASRSEHSDEEFRNLIKEAATPHTRRKVKEEVWEDFLSRTYYVAVDGDKKETFHSLKTKLESVGKERNENFNVLYYYATAPELFGALSSHLKSAGLITSGSDAARTAIIAEKPFGRDLATARELNKELRACFREEQIYRIDHYLGKETVQNILVFRFANGIFEPLWNHHYIDHIQISVAESVGVGTRAGFFDQHGILRDIVQNHILQMLSLLCIEPPHSLSSAESIRDEKVKVLKSIRRYTSETVRSETVRGQYTGGFLAGEKVAGYLDEADVPPGSETETFVAMKLEIDNWRWAGVPIYVRAGKRLPKRITEIAIYFKQVPQSLFKGRESLNLEQNVLAIQVQPDEGISLRVSSKPPGPRMRVRPVEMDFTYGASFGVESPEAYERLLLDAMKADPTLFARDDEIDEAWDLLSPVFDAWGSKESPLLHEYEAGSWGPAEAAAIPGASNHRWRRL